MGTRTSPPGPLSVYSEGEQDRIMLGSKANLLARDTLLTTLCLTQRGWLITIGVFVALMVVRLLQGQVIGAGLILCPLLLANARLR